MINTLLEHVPIKMETKDAETANNDDEGEHIKDDDDVDNSEEDEDDDEEDDEEEEEEEEDLESDALEVEQEVTMLMSSDEEAELEAQRIRFDKKPRKKSRDSKTSRSTSRNSNASQNSGTSTSTTSTLKDTNNAKEKKQKQLATTKDNKEPATNVAAAAEAKTTTQPQRISPRNKKENNKNLDNLIVSESRPVVRRQSNQSTCSVASSIVSEGAETESCANIYVYQQEQKLIFNCEFCDLKYGDLENLSRHLHETHRLFQQDEDHEKENSPRNLRNRGNQLPLKTQQQTLSVKKEPLQQQTSTAAAAAATTESTIVPPVALSLDLHTQNSLQSCGNVFILNHRKLFLICGHCESKYANVELFDKHLRQQHNIFEGSACNEVNVIPKTEIKEEVYIITEVVERPPVNNTEAMVSIPAEIPLDISMTEEAEVAEERAEPEQQQQEQTPIATEVSSPPIAVQSDIPNESDIISSIQIHDSGVTVAEIPMVVTELSAPVDIFVLDVPTSATTPPPVAVVTEETEQTLTVIEEIEEVIEQKVLPETAVKKVRKRRTSAPKVVKTKSPNKRPRRSIRKVVEPEPLTAQKTEPITTQKTSAKRKSPIIMQEAENVNETIASLPANETEINHQKHQEQPSTPLPSTILNESNEPTPKPAASKRKRKVIKAKIEKLHSPPTITAKREFVNEPIAERDEEFLEDPVAEIIEQIQNEINNSAGQIHLENTHIMPSTAVFVHPSQIMHNIKPHLSVFDSPEDIKPIFLTGEKHYACDECPRVFKKNVRLVEHKRVHTGEKPFACDECGKRFRIRMRLNGHKLRHSKIKKFICEICNLGFVTKQDLNLHLRHHNNDRRFQCTMCPKAFVRSSDLKIHLRVHTGEKPYVCDICHKCFRANQNLSVHKKSHMGDASKTYECEMCDKKFMRNIDRKVHMRSHTGEKPFKCEICDRSYSSRFNVRAHIERDHISANGLGAPPRGKKKPGPKPKALRAELEKQKKLIEELQAQLLQQIKTDEKDIPAEDENIQESGDDTSIIETITPTPQESDAYEISIPLTAIPSPPCLDNPFTKAKRKTSVTTTDAPLTITQKLEQHSSSPSSCASSTGSPQTPSPPKATTTKVVSQKTSLGIQQVSVTVSMQVENVTAGTTTEKENAGISNLQLTASTTTSATTPPNVKKERKITSYFTVLGQKAEV